MWQPPTSAKEAFAVKTVLFLLRIVIIAFGINGIVYQTVLRPSETRLELSDRYFKDQASPLANPMCEEALNPDEYFKLITEQEPIQWIWVIRIVILTCLLYIVAGLAADKVSQIFGSPKKKNGFSPAFIPDRKKKKADSKARTQKSAKKLDNELGTGDAVEAIVTLVIDSDGNTRGSQLVAHLWSHVVHLKMIRNRADRERAIALFVDGHNADAEAFIKHTLHIEALQAHANELGIGDEVQHAITSGNVVLAEEVINRQKRHNRRKEELEHLWCKVGHVPQQFHQHLQSLYQNCQDALHLSDHEFGKALHAFEQHMQVATNTSNPQRNAG